MKFLESFPSLKPYFRSSRIVGLLFAAGWCGDCTPVIPKVAMVVEGQNDLIQVVYVSSDRTPEQMVSFKPSVFAEIPFDSPERDNLKRHFQVCAMKESGELGITNRKDGIPTLILLESSSGKVLTMKAVDDIVSGQAKEGLLKKWQALLES